MLLSSASHQIIILSCLLLLLSAFTSGVVSHDSKRIKCCKKHEQNAPYRIARCNRLPATRKCLESILFTDEENRVHCTDPKAQWVIQRVNILQKNNIQCPTKH